MRPRQAADLRRLNAVRVLLKVHCALPNLFCSARLKLKIRARPALLLCYLSVKLRCTGALGNVSGMVGRTVTPLAGRFSG